jgi:hypothetical protein
MATISKTDALAKIQATNGKVFGVTFTKKDGTTRKMQCRLDVKKGVTGKGMAYKPMERQLLPVFDMANDGFRMVNLDTLSELRTAGETFNVS